MEWDWKHPYVICTYVEMCTLLTYKMHPRCDPDPCIRLSLSLPAFINVYHSRKIISGSSVTSFSLYCNSVRVPFLSCHVELWPCFLCKCKILRGVIMIAIVEFLSIVVAPLGCVVLLFLVLLLSLF